MKKLLLLAMLISGVAKAQYHSKEIDSITVNSLKDIATMVDYNHSAQVEWFKANKREFPKSIRKRKLHSTYISRMPDSTYKIMRIYLNQWNFSTRSTINYIKPIK